MNDVRRAVRLAGMTLVVCSTARVEAANGSLKVTSFP